MKTLVIAEKPSVGRDIAGALPGSFDKQDNYLESDDWVVTWAVGHLVELAAPEEYEDRFKKWRMADLPIVPEQFKLHPIDGKAEKQLKLIHKLMARDDVESVVNACDAGREGELIFAYVYETAKKQKPVQRLWLQSMTAKAIREAFEHLRPGDEMKQLEAAARSRSEADWLVGMNATRAASIRLRAAFDGAVSLGRVQTPTLALVARREEEIRAFKPEPYWLVEALFGAANGDYTSRYLGGKRLPEDEATKVVAATQGQAGHDHEAREEGGAGAAGPALRPHLAPAPGEHTLRVLSPPHPAGRAAPLRGAQGDHVSAHELPLHLGRSRRGDQADGELRRAERRVCEGGRLCDPPRRAAAQPRGQRREGHRPPRDHPDALRAQPRQDGRGRAADLRPRREALSRRLPPGGGLGADTRRDDRRGARLPHERPRAHHGRAGARSTAQEARPGGAEDDDTGGDQQLPRLAQDEEVETKKVESLRKETQPPRRFTEASLLAAMETAGKDISDADLREAMKDSGIGTPATRAAIIERLITVGYIEREGRALHATEKGIQVIRLLGQHPLTSAELTGGWEHRLGLIEQGTDSRPAFIQDIVKFTTDTVGELDKLKDVKIERANLGPCPICGRDVIENRKGYSCWSKDDPGCGFVVWKNKAGKTLTPAIVKELMANRRTEKPVTGFRGRSGRGFSAKLELVQNEEGKWRVEFDEEWARQPRPTPPDEDANGAEAAATAPADGAAPVAEENGDGAKPARRRKPVTAE